MKIVIDSNILFSAIIRDSTTRRLINGYDGKFLLPSFVFEEMIKHKEELYEKSNMNKEEFEEVLISLLEKIKLIPTAQIAQNLVKARQIVKEIDPDDNIFIGCALAYPGSIIWSNDKELKRQTEIRIINTKELLSLISQ